MATTREIVVYRIDVDADRPVKSYKDLIALNKQYKKELLENTDIGSEGFEKLRTSIKKNQETITAFNRDLRNSKSLADRVSEGFTKSFTQIGAFLVAAFSVDALLGAASQLQQFVGEINTGFARVNTVAQLSTAELEKLKSAAIEAGSQGATALNEIPDTLFNLISGTGDVNKSLELLDTSLKAADAGFADLEGTADAGINVYNAFKNEIDDTNRIFDILFATQREGKLTFDDLSKSIPNLAPAAKVSGQSLETISAALAAITRQGIGVNQAETALSRLLNSFGDSQKLEKFEETLARTGKSVFDAEGQFRPLIEIIGDLDSVLDSASNDQERAAIFGDLNLDKNSLVALTSLTEGYEDFESVLNGVVNSQGELDKQYDLSDNAARRLAITQNELKAELFELGSDVTPALTEAKVFLTRALLSLLQGFRGFFNFIKENEGVLAVLRTGLVAISTIVASRFLPSIKNLIPSLATLFGGVSKLRIGITALFTAIRANPIGFTVTAAYALYEAFQFLNSESEESLRLQEAQKNVTDSLTEAYGKEKVQLDTLFKPLLDDNTAREDKVLALENLKKAYPDLIDLSKDDLDNQEKLKLAYDAVNDSILKRLVNQSLQQQLEKDADAIFKLNSEIIQLNNNNDELVKTTDKIGFAVASAAVGIKNAFSSDENQTSLLDPLQLSIKERQDQINQINANAGTLREVAEKTAESLKNVDFGGILAELGGGGANTDTPTEVDIPVNVKPSKSSIEDAKKAFENAYKEAVKNVSESRRNIVAQSELDFLNSDRNVEAQKTLAREIRDSKINEINQLIAIDEQYGKTQEVVTNERLLAIKKLEETFNKEISDIDKKALAEREKLTQDAINSQLNFLSNQISSLNNELTKVDLDIQKNQTKLLKDGVDIVELAQRRKNDIYLKFGLEQLEIQRRLADQQADIEFEASNKSAADSQKLNTEKLRNELSFAEAKLQLLKSLGKADEDATKELSNQITLLKTQLGNVVGDNEAVIKESSEKVAKSLGRVQQAIDILANFSKASFQNQINQINGQIETVTANLEGLKETEQSLQGEIQFATEEQLEALENQRSINEQRVKEEQANLKRLEAEREKIRKQEAANEKRLAILKAIIAGAVQAAQNVLNPIALGIIAASVAAQVALINSTNYSKGGLLEPMENDLLYSYGGGVFPSKYGGLIKGGSHKSGRDIPFTVGGEKRVRRAEGGEYISSVPSTNLFYPVFDYLNQLGNKMGKSASIPNRSVSYAVPARNNRYSYAEGGRVVNQDEDRLGNDMSEVVQAVNALGDKVENLRFIFSIAEFQDKYIEFLQGDTDE